MNKIKKGETLEYPAKGQQTAKVTCMAVENPDSDNPLYVLHGAEGKFKINIYHSALEKTLESLKQPEPKADRKALRIAAKGLGLKFPKNIKTDQLEALIEAKKNGAPIDEKYLVE